MDGQHDSLWALQQLLETWAAGARDEEIARLIAARQAELWRRGHAIRSDAGEPSP
jgi:hypothetical protein